MVFSAVADVPAAVAKGYAVVAMPSNLPARRFIQLRNDSAAHKRGTVSESRTSERGVSTFGHQRRGAGK
jgi:hypothetical protein